MRRFLLFHGKDYYPAGGIDDLLESFDTIESAKEYFNEYVAIIYEEKKVSFDSYEDFMHNFREFEFAYIYDSELMEKVWEMKKNN